MVASFGGYASGQVVGESRITGNTVTHAYSWTAKDGMVDLGTLGGTDSYGNGVNASGQVVGQSQTGDGAFHAARWQTSDGH